MQRYTATELVKIGVDGHELLAEDFGQNIFTGVP